MDIYLERIKPLFVNSGKTDAEIEREIGIPPKTINKWNSGLKSYRKYIAQIAKYFGVDADYLLGNTDDPRPVQELAEEGQQKKPTLQDESELIPGYNDLSEENKAKTKDFIAFLLSQQ